MTSTQSIFLSLALFFFAGTLQPATITSNNETDLYALLAIKSKITHDPQRIMSSWNNSFHFCQWGGIKCGHMHKRVTVLDLRSRSLVGSLSPSIGNLTFLREINLQNNTLGGNIPPEIGRLHRLQLLDLTNNSFDGEIPANLSRCYNLTQLWLGNNKLVGHIPNEFGSLLNLKYLIIQQNKFNGPVPPFIGNFTYLEKLGAAYNYLSGRIPDSLGQLNHLNFLGFGVNNLSGTIPDSIYNISSLSAFSLPENKLYGRLPLGLGLMLPQLKNLQLRDNYFTGSLPSSLSNCSDLETLGMERNNFSGKIGINFGGLPNMWLVTLFLNNFGSGEHDEMDFLHSMVNCTNLHVLDIHDNQFSGMLPNSLANFSTHLFYLSLGQNFIYGNLPSAIGDLISLTSFGFDFSNLNGPIPTTIGKLLKLQRLTLEGSDFSGKIPESMGNLSLLNELALGYNRLEGPIPASLGKCKQLALLTVSDNNLSGDIPKELFGISTLSISLNLARNQLVGPLPQEVGNLKNLIMFDVSDNGLSGEIPSSLSSCTSLQALYLAGNFFRDSLPTSLSSLRGLERLDLSRNNLSGQIPRFIEQLSLNYLNLSYNDFEGEVPMAGVFINTSVTSVVGNNRLCGGVSDLQLPKCIVNKSREGKKRSIIVIIVISMVCTLVCVITVLSFFFFWHKRRINTQPSGSSLKVSCVNVTYASLLKATNGFCLENLIGVGGFGSVYKGILDENGLTVAVKVLNLQHRGASKSFMAECEALRNIRHRNLVKIITTCSSVDFQGDDFKALVYEFMENGSLDMWLHSSIERENGLNRFGLIQRISIAVDVACALDYLHNHCQTPIVHCDLKPSNILLDHDMIAHVGDFGLARLLSTITGEHQSSSVGIRGTIGYAPPEYGVGSEVSRNGDIYSYGILLLEMVTGKRPTDPIFQEGLNLHKFASKALPDKVMEIVEPMLLNNDEEEVEPAKANKNRAKTGKSREDCLRSMVKIGVACSMESPQDRMDINKAIHELNSVQSILEEIQNGS